MVIKFKSKWLLLSWLLVLTLQVTAKPQASVSIDASKPTILTILLTKLPAATDWAIGFFMLQVLNKPDVHLNMQVCANSRCDDLFVDQRPLSKSLVTFTRPDLTQGHVVLLKPKHLLRLNPNQHYIIRISGLAQIPQNITAMPQKFFFYDFPHKVVTNIQTTAYQLHNYQESALLHAEKQQIRHNWYKTHASVPNSVLVPLPVIVIPKTNYFAIANLKTIYAPLNQKQNTNFISTALKQDLKLKVTISYTVNPGQVGLQLLPCSAVICKTFGKNPEGYVLDINKSNIKVYANSSAGYFYAYQSLRQLWNYKQQIPQQTIIDYPHFQYRGIMLDTVRHFFTVSQVKMLLDVMAAHKLNTLHFHLADDEGWRIELAKFPQLTTVAAKRSFGYTIGPSNLVDDKYDISNVQKLSYADAATVYHGFYTQADIKELIRYANARQITLLPEIEMPGHARALKKAMPAQFFSTKDKSIYQSVQGYTDNVLPICNYAQDQEFTLAINQLVASVADLFSKQTTIYAQDKEVSLAGDEIPDTALRDFSACKTGAWQGLTTINLAHLFFQKIAQQLPDYKLSGWQQLVQTDSGVIDKNSLNAKYVGHIWQWMPTNNKPISGYALANGLTKHNYPVVLDFADLSYFDMRYSRKWDEPGLYWATTNSGTYASLSIAWLSQNIAKQAQILGIEGVLWSELIPSTDHLFYMALPKMAGLADSAWSPVNQLNWPSLASRLGCGKSGFLNYLYRVYNVRYRGYPHGIAFEVPQHTLCAATKLN